MFIHYHMTPEPVAMHPGETVAQAIEILEQHSFRHLPVVDDEGNMIGLVSIGDAVSARLKELNAERDALTGMIMGT